MNEWISVKDRMPKPIKEVLTYYADRVIGVDWTDHDGEFTYGDLYGGVTHWMPLPEAPEEVEG